MWLRCKETTWVERGFLKLLLSISEMNASREGVRNRNLPRLGDSNLIKDELLGNSGTRSYVNTLYDMCMYCICLHVCKHPLCLQSAALLIPRGVRKCVSVSQSSSRWTYSVRRQQTCPVVLRFSVVSMEILACGNTGIAHPPAGRRR